MTEKINKIRQWEKVAECVGFVMSIISMMFTVRLMSTFATDTTEYYLYIAFGGTVQVAQVCLFVYAIYLNWAAQNGKAVTAFCLFCLLFVLSLAGTLGAFITSNKVQNNQELTQDLRLQDMQKRADSLDQQIERSQELIDGYQRRKLLTKGAIPEGKRLDRLNAERAALSKEMADYKPEGTADSLYTGLAKLLGGDPEEIKMGLFALYAVALDLVSAVLLAFSLGFMGHTKSDDGKGHVQDSEKPEYPNPQSIPEPAFQLKGKSPETASLQNSEEAPVVQRDGLSEKPKQRIGFIKEPQPQRKPERKNKGFIVDPEVIRAYLTTAYRGEPRPKSLMGRRAIGDKIGCRNEETDHIHSLLKRKGVVKVAGKRTIPLMNLSEALARIA